MPTLNVASASTGMESVSVPIRPRNRYRLAPELSARRRSSRPSPLTSPTMIGSKLKAPDTVGNLMLPELASTKAGVSKSLPGTMKPPDVLEETYRSWKRSPSQLSAATRISDPTEPSPKIALEDPTEVASRILGQTARPKTILTRSDPTKIRSPNPSPLTSPISIPGIPSPKL